MNGNVIESELAERDPGLCVCKGGPTLDVLDQVHRAYEHRMQGIDNMACPQGKKLQMQVELLRSWVSDLVAQNKLLARAVEELEAEATTRVFIERRRHTEEVSELKSEAATLRRRLACKDSDLRGLLEVLRRLRDFDYFSFEGIHFFENDNSVDCGNVNELKVLNNLLHKENISKDREIRQLNKDLKQNEQTIQNLRNELSMAKCQRHVSKKDVEVMAGCFGTECDDWEPVKDSSELLNYKEQIERMEKELKCNMGDVIALRTTNVSLHKELRMLRGVSAALAGEVRDVRQRSDFKDHILRELRAQLKRAKLQMESRSMIPVCCGSSSRFEVLTTARRGSTSSGHEDVGTCTTPRTCTPSFECSTPRSVDRGQCMNITFEDKCTLTPKLPPCEECHKPNLPKQQCSTAIINTQDVIPPLHVIVKDIEDILLKAERRHYEDKPALPAKNTQDLIPLRRITLNDKELNADRRHCENKRARHKSETAGTATTCTQDLLPSRCLNAEETDEILLKADFRHWENKPAPPTFKCLTKIIQCKPGSSCAVKNTQDLIPLRRITLDDKELNADHRHCENKRVRHKSETAETATTCTQDLLPPRCQLNKAEIKLNKAAQFSSENFCKTATKCTQALIPPPGCMTTENIQEILLEANRRYRCGNKSAQTTPENSCQTAGTAAKCTLDLISPRGLTTEDIYRHSRDKLRTCACAPEEELKSSSLHSLKSKGISPRVSLYENASESFGGSSDVHSPSGSCASARAQFYHNKLLATIQILQNKEETVRIQAESLSVAEARIVSLTARNTELKRELDRKNRQIQILEETIEKTKCANARIAIPQCDVSIITDIHEKDKEDNIVKTLQNNLSVIEELYRECFYETAKQEGIIEMLRKSYLDVRLVEREKSDQITRLNNVINTQKWSLDRCQDIASEVDNLKIEITNFLNNSNNDSGVWEESADGVMEDLEDINTHLLHLRELLTGDCTCGLEQENKRLEQENKRLKESNANVQGDCKCGLEQENKRLEQENKRLQQDNKNQKQSNENLQGDCTCELEQENKRLVTENKRLEQENKKFKQSNANLQGDCTCELKQENKRLEQENKKLKLSNANLQKQVRDLLKQVNELENILGNKEAADEHFEEQILQKESELRSIRQRLLVLEDETKQCCNSSGDCTKKLHETEALLKEKCAETRQLQSKCRRYEEALLIVRDECQKYEHCNTEVCSLREENKQLAKAARSLKSRLVDAQRHASSLEECCRQESVRARELEAELREAAARGAALCAAVRRCVRTVNTWADFMKEHHQQQTELLQQKDNQIRCLRHLLGHDINATGASETCNTCQSSPTVEKRCNEAQIQSGIETEPTSTFNRKRCKSVKVQSASEMPCCSKWVTTDSIRSGEQRQDHAGCTSASEVECLSMPTPQPLWKKILCKKSVCEAQIQHPVRSDGTTCVCDVPRHSSCDATRNPYDAGNSRACDREVRYCTSTSWSPCEEVFSRAEGAGAALAAAVRRWRRPHPHRHSPTV